MITGDSQLRWIGPEKGVIHLATAAVVNAVWDLWAKAAGKPIWQLVGDMAPAELVRCVDFRYISDAITPAEALAILERNAPTRAERVAHLRAQGFPAYTTSTGWLGYSDEKVRRLCREALAEGWTHFKIKVGVNIDDDCRRAALMREEIGPDHRLALDANQVWEVHEAIENMRRLAAYDPWWIEEPTSPDDVLGHAAIRRGISPVRVATGEHIANRVVVKQLLQAEAIDVLQLDACRVSGVTENVAILLLAAKYGVPVCPHAGGVGLCEVVQHLSMFDYLAVSGTRQVIEYVDHLHEHFTDPVRVRDGHYQAPTLPGMSAEIRAESLVEYAYPDGPAWRA
jgi:L-fuconate dehydratase